MIYLLLTRGTTESKKCTLTNLFDGGGKGRILGDQEVVLGDNVLRVGGGQGGLGRCGHHVVGVVAEHRSRSRL